MKKKEHNGLYTLGNNRRHDPKNAGRARRSRRADMAIIGARTIMNPRTTMLIAIVGSDEKRLRDDRARKGAISIFYASLISQITDRNEHVFRTVTRRRLVDRFPFN